MTMHLVTHFVGRRPHTQCGIFVENENATANYDLVDCKRCRPPRPEHIPNYRPRTLGRTMAGGRLVGYTITCSCGWSYKTNENKKEARSWFIDHVKESKNAVQGR